MYLLLLHCKCCLNGFNVYLLSSQRTRSRDITANVKQPMAGDVQCIVGCRTAYAGDATCTLAAFAAQAALWIPMVASLSGVRLALAGPLMTWPCRSNAEPWQGQSKVPSFGFHCTHQQYLYSATHTKRDNVPNQTLLDTASYHPTHGCGCKSLLNYCASLGTFFDFREEGWHYDLDQAAHVWAHGVVGMLLALLVHVHSHFVQAFLHDGAAAGLHVLNVLAVEGIEVLGKPLSHCLADGCQLLQGLE